MKEGGKQIDECFTAADGVLPNYKGLLGHVLLIIGYVGSRQPILDETKLQQSLTEAVR